VKATEAHTVNEHTERFCEVTNAFTMAEDSWHMSTSKHNKSKHRHIFRGFLPLLVPISNVTVVAVEGLGSNHPMVPLGTEAAPAQVASHGRRALVVCSCPGPWCNEYGMTQIGRQSMVMNV